MSEFKVGDRVKVNSKYVGKPFVTGAEGVIKTISEDLDFPYRVKLDVMGTMCFSGHELELTAQPVASASAPAAGEAWVDPLPYADFIRILAGEMNIPVDEVDHWTLIESYRQDKALLETTESELAAARQQLAAAVEALKPFAAEWSEWQKFAERGGEMNITEFFVDCLDDHLLAEWLHNAARAASAEGE